MRPLLRPARKPDSRDLAAEELRLRVVETDNGAGGVRRPASEEYLGLARGLLTALLGGVAINARGRRHRVTFDQKRLWGSKSGSELPTIVLEAPLASGKPKRLDFDQAPFPRRAHLEWAEGIRVGNIVDATIRESGLQPWYDMADRRSFIATIASEAADKLRTTEVPLTPVTPLDVAERAVLLGNIVLDVVDWVIYPDIYDAPRARFSLILPVGEPPLPPLSANAP